jgi:hypothetical protein
MPWNEGSALGSVIGAAAAYHGIKERKKKTDLENRKLAADVSIAESTAKNALPRTGPLPWDTTQPTATGASPSGTSGASIPAVAAATGAAAAAKPPASTVSPNVHTLGTVVAHAARNVAAPPPAATVYPDQANLDTAERNYVGVMTQITDPYWAAKIPDYKDAYVTALNAKNTWLDQQAAALEEARKNARDLKEFKHWNDQEYQAYVDGLEKKRHDIQSEKDSVNNNIRSTTATVRAAGVHVGGAAGDTTAKETGLKSREQIAIDAAAKAAAILAHGGAVNTGKDKKTGANVTMTKDGTYVYDDGSVYTPPQP